MLSGLSAEEFSKLVMSVGTHHKRRHLSPIEVSELLARALEENEPEDIADALALKGPDMIRRFTALTRLPPAVQGLVTFSQQRGRIPFSTAFEISRVDSEADREFLAKAVLEHALTKKEVEAIVQRHQRGDIPVDEALTEILKLRPKVENQFLYIGRVRLDLEDAKAQQLLRKALARFVGGSNVLSVSVRSGNFAILLTEEGSQHPDIADRLTATDIGQFVTELVRAEAA